MPRNGPETARQLIAPPCEGHTPCLFVSVCRVRGCAVAAGKIYGFKTEADRDSEAPSLFDTVRCYTCETYDYMGFGNACPCVHVNGRCTTRVQPPSRAERED